MKIWEKLNFKMASFVMKLKLSCVIEAKLLGHIFLKFALCAIIWIISNFKKI